MSWLSDTFSGITSIVKYDMVSLVCHSLRGVVNIQVFVVMDFWKGCDSIGTVNLRVQSYLVGHIETLSLLRCPIAERRDGGAAERVHAKGFVDSVANFVETEACWQRKRY